MGLLRQARAPASPPRPQASKGIARTTADVDGGDFVGRNLAGHDFTKKTIRNTLFDQSTLDGANLTLATFAGCSFNAATLNKATLKRTTFENCKFDSARIEHADAREAMFITTSTISYGDANNRQPEFAAAGTGFDHASLSGSNFAGAALIRAMLNDVTAINVNFRDAKLQGSVFDRCTITGSNFLGAHLDGADFSLCPEARTVLPESALGVVAFFKPIDQAALDAAVAAHEQWLGSNGQSGRRLVLRAIDLARKNVQGRDLSGSDLRQCRLDNARFENTRLIAADLRQASLFCAMFRGCDLRGAKLDTKSITKMRLDGTRL